MRSAVRRASATTADDIPDLYELAPGVGLSRVPVVATGDQLSRLSLDPATRRLLALVDGSSTFAAILRVSKVPIVDALPAVRRLIRGGIVEVRAGA